MTVGSLARSKILRLVLTASLICVFPARTLAWGEKAHRIIAALAWLKLSDDSKKRVIQLLGETKDPSGPLTAVATWADLRAVQYPDERKWHYVDIPLAEQKYYQPRDCADWNCIVEKLNQKKVELQSPRSSRLTRLQALKFIVHLVGDVHQPLHCTDNNDSAGNRVQVRFFGKVTNLHKLWDFDMIERSGLSEDQYVTKLSGIPTSPGGWIEDWANNSHSLARTYVYVISQDRELGTAYYKTNLPILDRQLAIAAEKLAQVLGDALTPPAPARRKAR